MDASNVSKKGSEHGMNLSTNRWVKLGLVILTFAIWQNILITIVLVLSSIAVKEDG